MRIAIWAVGSLGALVLIVLSYKYVFLAAAGILLVAWSTHQLDGSRNFWGQKVEKGYYVAFGFVILMLAGIMVTQVFMKEINGEIEEYFREHYLSSILWGTVWIILTIKTSRNISKTMKKGTEQIHSLKQ